jgi:NADH:ubiquinone oxidoreductase subunit 4 (subunit M)
MAVFITLIAAIVWIGLYPQPLLNTAKPALDALPPPPGVEQIKMLSRKYNE